MDVLTKKQVTIQGLDDKNITIPIDGAQNGMKRRIAGAGLPDFFNKKERGDLVVTFNLQIPNLNKKQKKQIKSILEGNEL
jgi:DnaJ-class molecular chaperone